jgi:starch synthase
MGLRASAAPRGQHKCTQTKPNESVLSAFICGLVPLPGLVQFSVARVLMVSSEAAPLAKTGGLADVVGSLPLALRSFGDEVAVVIPRYGSIDLKGARRVYDHIPVHFGPVRYDTAIYQAAEEYPVFLVDCPPLYDRKGFYGESGIDYPDNHIRFAVFARAAIGVARGLFRTDLFHCHDWQAGLLPAYLTTTFATDPTFLGTRTLFTVHNLGYQGLFPTKVLPDLALDGTVYRPDGMEFFGQISYVKSGIAFSDALNTVSPTYAREIQTPEYGFGLDGILRARANVLSGILNGVDYREWSPDTDPLIPARYSVQDLSGKRICKEQLLQEFGLPLEQIDRPLIGIVSRFTRQKGADLLAEVAGEIVAEDTYLVALGTGDPEYEEFFRRMTAEHPGRIAVRIGFDNALAHRIEAGADIFLMPSRYEPCGLNQIYSLRYGTVPVVRATGGLDDTIEEGTGFKFAEYSGQALLGAIREAVGAFSNQDAWREMMRRGMEKDFSWKASAGAYSALYRRMLEGA